MNGIGRDLGLLAVALGLGACGTTREVAQPPPIEAPQPVDLAPAVPAESAEAEPDEVRELDVPKEMAEPREPAHPWEADGVRSAVSRGGTYTVMWRPVGGRVPKNEHFEIVVWLFRGTGDELEPVPGARLAVSGWMPEHGHGMIRRPQATDNGDGSYLVRGMLLHMAGHWDLFFDVIVDGVSERADFQLDL